MKRHNHFAPLKRMSINVLLLAGSFLLVTCAGTAPEAPNGLTISEGFEDPLGFYDASPTFSWKLPAAGEQAAYEIEVTDADGATVWQSGRVNTSATVGVPYAGPELQSRQQLEWRVRYENPSGELSGWSESASVEYGLLTNEDWQGKWVGAATPAETTEFNLPFFRPLTLRKNFTIDGLPEQARLYITAKGVFRAQLNGQRIGNDEMTPGYTPYQHRIETLTYDVTDLLQVGGNELTATLSEGWYAGRIGYTLPQWTNTDSPRLLAQLETDGQVLVVTDESWQTQPATPLTYSSIYDGEFYSELQPTEPPVPVIAEALEPTVMLRPKRHATVKIRKTLPTQNITSVKPGATIFDLGQNMVGVPHLRVPVKKGDTLWVRFAEMLDLDGDIFTKNYRSARSTDYYVAAEDGKIDWTPSFTFHGFRYVELSGYSPQATPAKGWVEGKVLYSDFSTAGTFTSSHSKLNQLQQNIEWGLRGNFLDIPTDCPQRDERLGWTGDAQVFAPTSLFLTSTHAFWASWLQSMREEQLPNGAIPFIIPNINVKRSSAGWGDAATIIPWEVYFRTGDTTVLRENYDMMRQWVGYYESKAKDHLVDFQSFGDWLQPYPANGNNRGDTPREFICTAYFARSTELCGRAARVLGRVEEAKQLDRLHQSIKTALRQAYFDEAGRITQNRATQTAYLLALGFDLLPEKLAPLAVNHLINEIELADGHLRTGFLGTPLLAPVLDRYGHAELAYELLFRETYPSWFYSINQGATTMWERWNSYTLKDGFNPGGMNSFNHYAYGAIGQWMYERVAGIAPRAPGYREISFAPVINPPLTSAAATHESPYGHISSAWTVIDGHLDWEIIVPPNSTGFITIPKGYKADYQLIQIADDGSTVAGEATNSNEELRLTSGKYRVTSTLNK